MDTEFHREGPDRLDTNTSYFKSIPQILLNTSQIPDQLQDAVNRIGSLTETFTCEGSGWVVDRIKNVTLHIATYDPIGGSSYVKTPRWVENKKATLNIKNTDNFCFLYSVLAASHPQKINAERKSKYSDFLEELKIHGLTFPLTLAQIPLFETNNSDYSINVLCPASDEDKHFVPLYASQHRRRKHVVNLMLLSEGDKRHYVLIRNLSRLLAARNSHVGKSYPCPYCLYCFSKEEGLENHIDDCGKHGLQNVQYPSPDNNVLTYSNRQNEMALPFSLYADFECFLDSSKKTEGKFYDTHVPSGFCCLTVSTFPEYNNEKPYVYSGSNVMDEFFKYLKREQARIKKILAKNELMKPLTDDQTIKYDTCENCPSCDTALTKENKIRHHCHVSGNFLSALCNNCNLQMKFKKRIKGRDDVNYLIPVVFHNHRGYDSHVILKNLSRFFAPNDVFVIANNMEKYLAFEVDGLRFLDSLQFLNCSLDTLVKNSSKDGEDKFIHMRRLYPNDEQFKLLLRKGIFPYEHMDSEERMSETCLPPQEKFYSRLTDENISDADYSHAQKVWKAFNMSTMRQYHDRYLE